MLMFYIHVDITYEFIYVILHVFLLLCTCKGTLDLHSIVNVMSLYFMKLANHTLLIMVYVREGWMGFTICKIASPSINND